MMLQNMQHIFPHMILDINLLTIQLIILQNMTQTKVLKIRHIMLLINMGMIHSKIQDMIRIIM
jgi:hypothetical protein